MQQRVEKVKAPKAPKEKATPAWIAFTAGVKAHLEAEGLVPEIEEQKGFVQYLNPSTQQKLYIAKQGRAVTRIETTLDLVGVIDGAHPLPEDRPNGKIACSLDPDHDTVLEAMRMLMTSTEKLRPAKRTAKEVAADQKSAEQQAATPAS